MSNRLSALGKRWTYLTPAPEALALGQELKLHPQVASLLWEQGHRSTEAVRAFLEPSLQSLGDPFLLVDLRTAAEQITEAVQQKKKIVIFGDYDVDGITSAALLWRVLRRLDAQVETFLPLRMEEGYGLSQEGVERCVAEHQPELLIAVDCGTTATAQVAWLREKGIKVVIIDHHALPAECPQANALVNPQRDGRWQYLATVGLVFKVAHGLLKLHREEERTLDLREMLDLVAVGTVADIVPLVEENRVLVRRGLRQIEMTTNPGLRALAEVSQITFPVTAQHVGFRLGPRLNASGRLGDATLSLRLLQTDDPAEARSIAAELNQNNRERQAVELETFQQAEAQLLETFDPTQDWGIVLCGQNWHWGVIGIVASRIQKSFHRPTFIIGLDADGYGKGSGRSIEGVSLIRALEVCREHLSLYGGHDMAAGLNIEAKKVDAFRKAFNAYVRASAEDHVFQASLKLSGQLSLAEVDDTFYQQLEDLAPFGRSNPEPVFALTHFRYARPPRVFGKNHLKLFLRAGNREMEAVGFGLGQHDFSQPPAELAGVVEWDDYQQRVQVRIVDWR